jgi:hypothetical protein
MAESEASWSEGLASLISKNFPDGSARLPAGWIRFHSGIHPGIHPDRWPSWVPGELIPILSRDERAVSIVFSGGEDAPAWIPSWFHGDENPVITMINEDPAVLPRLHAMVSAAVARRALPLVISSVEKRALLSFLGQEILSKALYVLPRLNFPSLEPWIDEAPTSWSGVEEMSLRGASVLLAAIAETPESFRQQVLLTLHGSAGDQSSHGTPDPLFMKVAVEFVLRCGELLSREELAAASN